MKGRISRFSMQKGSCPWVVKWRFSEHDISLRSVASSSFSCWLWWILAMCSHRMLYSVEAVGLSNLLSRFHDELVFGRLPGP
jgi:hypothetical protein